MIDIQRVLDDAAFWFFERLRAKNGSFYLQGRIPNRPKEFIRISGERPLYRLTVDAPDAEIHRTVQDTILPAIGARHLKPL